MCRVPGVTGTTTLGHDVAQQAVEGRAGQDPGRAAPVVELQHARHAVEPTTRRPVFIAEPP